MTPANQRQVVELTAADTHALRLEVLRRDTPTKVVEFPEDDFAGTRHFGITIDGTLVAVSSWVPKPYHDAPAVQLRGMATTWTLQSSGVGGDLLEAGCSIMADEGVPLIWARARDAALGFYLRHEFHVVGDGFIDEATQLPHHVVVRHLT